MVHELIGAIDGTEEEHAVAATLVTGAGRTLCGGADSCRGPFNVRTGAIDLGAPIASSDAPNVLAVTRKLLWRGLVTDDPRDRREVDSRATFVRGRRAVAEGVTALLETRRPVFSHALDQFDEDEVRGGR